MFAENHVLCQWNAEDDRIDQRVATSADLAHKNILTSRAGSVVRGVAVGKDRLKTAWPRARRRGQLHVTGLQYNAQLLREDLDSAVDIVGRSTTSRTGDSTKRNRLEWALGRGSLQPRHRYGSR